MFRVSKVGAVLFELAECLLPVRVSKETLLVRLSEEVTHCTLLVRLSKEGVFYPLLISLSCNLYNYIFSENS